jgi:hypothetical protein
MTSREMFSQSWRAIHVLLVANDKRCGCYRNPGSSELRGLGVASRVNAAYDDKRGHDGMEASYGCPVQIF